MHLVLDTFGTRLHSQDGLLGITHPTDGPQRVAPAGVRSISVGRGVTLTSDALLLALRHEVDVLLLEKSGQPAGRLHSGRYGSVATIRRRQVSFAQGPAGAAWVVGLVERKLEHQAATVLLVSARHLPEALARPALRRLRTAAERVRALILPLPPPTVGVVAARLRGLEGAASATYFATLNQALPEELRFAGRSQHPARDAFNCLLNYAYGVLYGLVEGALTPRGPRPLPGGAAPRRIQPPHPGVRLHRRIPGVGRLRGDAALPAAGGNQPRTVRNPPRRQRVAGPAWQAPSTAMPARLPRRGGDPQPAAPLAWHSPFAGRPTPGSGGTGHRR